MNERASGRADAPSPWGWRQRAAAFALLVLAPPLAANAGATSGMRERGRTAVGTVKLETCTRPVHPEQAPGETPAGKVTIAFLIDPAGSVKDAKLVKSSGYRVLDMATIAAFSKCRFNPAIINGAPEQSWVVVQYDWTERLA